MDWESTTTRCEKLVERHLAGRPVAPLAYLMCSMPPLLLWTVGLVSPHTYTVPHNTLDDTDLVCTPGREMRDLNQRIICLVPVRLGHHTLIVVGYVLARLFQ